MSKKMPITVSSWTLGDKCTFEERVKAAAEAGYDGIGLRAETYVDALAEGLHDEDILAILDKYGIRCTEVEYITMWCEEPRSYEQMYKEQICFHMCDLFGVEQINCGLMETYDVDYTAQKLKELCQRAGKYNIGVEPMPYSGIPDIKKGWAVVKGADCPNAMLHIDTWHWMKYHTPVDVAELADIPADKFCSIQINDVWERDYAPTVLRDESMHDRLAPSAGEGPGIGCTADWLKMVKAHGIVPKQIGVEVISDVILAKGVAEAAKITYDGAVKALEAAGWTEALED